MTRSQHAVALAAAVVVAVAVVLLVTVLSGEVADGTGSQLGPYPTGDGDQIEVSDG